MLLLLWSRDASAERVSWLDQFAAARGDAVALDATGVYVGGDVWAGSDVQGYVRKYSTDGALLWTRQFTNPNQVTGLATYGGNVYVGGYTWAGGDTQSFIQKFTGDGTHVWTQAVPKSQAQFAFALGADASGVYIVGNKCCYTAFVKKYSHDGVGGWTEVFGAGYTLAHGVAADATGVYVGGYTAKELVGPPISGSKDGDAYVRKYDSATGAVVWTTQFGTPSPSGSTYGFNEYVYGLAKDATGVYLSGVTQGGSFPGYVFAGRFYDPFIAKVGNDGAVEWTHQFGTATDETALGIAADGINVYTTGVISYDDTFPGQVNYGGYDLFVHAVDATDGTAVWTRQFGTGGFESGSAAAVDASGVYVSGYSEGVGSAFPGESTEGGSAFMLVMDKLTNAAPVALDDVANTTVNHSVAVDVLANDSDSDSAIQFDYYRADGLLRVHSFTAPAHGVAEMAPSGGGVTYSPYCGFRGTDNFSYTVTDAAGKTATATVQIVVSTERPADPSRPDSPGRPCSPAP